MDYGDSNYSHCDCCCAVTQPYNFGAEAHLDDGDTCTSAFVMPSPPLLEHSLRLSVPVKLGLQRFLPPVVISCHLLRETHHAGEVVSGTERCNNCLSSL